MPLLINYAGILVGMEERFQVGVITQTHGIHGEVKVYPTTDDNKRFKKCKELILDTGKGDITLKVMGVKFFKQFVILKFEGYDSIESVEKFRQKSLFVTRENAVKLSKDEYFIADLIDCEVFDEEGNKIGNIKDVMQTGANDVYIIENSEGRELLFPAIKECVKKVDVEAGKVIVHVMDGLLDL